MAARWRRRLVRVPERRRLKPPVGRLASARPWPSHDGPAVAGRRGASAGWPVVGLGGARGLPVRDFREKWRVWSSGHVARARGPVRRRRVGQRRRSHGVGRGGGLPGRRDAGRGGHRQDREGRRAAGSARDAEARGHLAFVVVQPDGSVATDRAQAECVACHRDAPRDFVFRLPAAAPAASAGKTRRSRCACDSLEQQQRDQRADDDRPCRPRWR